MKRSDTAVLTELEANEKIESDFLNTLPRVEGAAFDDEAQQAQLCVEGTRVQILDDVRLWANDQDAQPGFWLSGMAGTGKSTIARTVAHMFHQRPDDFYVGSFFFRRGAGDRGTTAKFTTTVLRQIAVHTELQSHFLWAWSENPDIACKGLQYQWRRLFRDALSGVKHKTILLVIDAIDESRSSNSSTYEMFEFLSNRDNFAGLNIRFFITSRPQEQREAELYDVFVLHNVPKMDVAEDIRTFFRAKFKAFFDSEDRSSSFPTEDQIDELTLRSIPLFISAVTSFEFITESLIGVEERFHTLLNQTRGMGGEENLDNMYLIVIEDVLFKTRNGVRKAQIIRQKVDTFQILVGSVVTLRESLNYENIALLLDMSTNDVRVMIKSFRAIFYLPEYEEDPVQVFHQSLIDFLKDRERVEMACLGIHDDNSQRSNKQLIEPTDVWIDENISNTHLFWACLRIMEGSEDPLGPDKLKENICDLAGPGSLAWDIEPDTLQEKIPTAMRYACRYFISHFVSMTADQNALAGLLEFFNRYFLEWVEAMSCLGNLIEAITLLNQLDTFLEVSINSFRIVSYL